MKDKIRAKLLKKGDSINYKGRWGLLRSEFNYRSEERCTLLKREVRDK
jgi:hypothetical protein